MFSNVQCVVQWALEIALGFVPMMFKGFRSDDVQVIALFR